MKTECFLRTGVCVCMTEGEGNRLRGATKSFQKVFFSSDLFLQLISRHNSRHPST